MTKADKLLEKIYSITGKGLEKTETDIYLQPNTFYFLGASGSPDKILVTKIDNTFIYYKEYPYYKNKESKIEKTIGMDLIIKGTRTWLKSGYVIYYKDLAKSLKNMLDGKPGTKVNLKDYEPVIVFVVPIDKDPKKDFWREAEKYGNVGINAKTKEYEISTDRKTVEKIKKDKIFDVKKVIDRK